MEIKFYTKNQCSLCEKGKKVLDQLDLHYQSVDIYQDDALLETYMFRIPVVTVNGQVADEGILSYDTLKEVIDSATHDTDSFNKKN